MPILDLQDFLQNMKLQKDNSAIGSQILKEIRSRIQFLMDVGLDYLSLSRATGTLSGGEGTKRIRLCKPRLVRGL